MSSSEAVWHELECGSYRADLALWRELALRSATDGNCARILDVGAGTGRVALELARAGHRVTALDLDSELLAALDRRAEGAGIETVCADARTFALPERGFDLCLLAMQTVQLFNGAREREAFLGRARVHLRPGGLLGVAIVTEFEPFDCADGDPVPSAETARVDGAVYASRATLVRVEADRVRIEREREIIPDPRAAHSGESVRRSPPREGEHSVVELHRLDAPQLEREAIAAGLAPAFTTELAPTEDHVASTVVVLRA